MESEEIRRLLERFRKKRYSPHSFGKTEERLLEAGNEDLIKNALEESLENFEVDKSKAKGTDFKALFRKIQTRLPAGDQTQFVSLPERTRQRRSIGHVVRMAAAFLLLFCSGILFSYLYNSFNLPEPRHAIIKAPLGAKSEIILPDGSHVWLNAGSSIKYEDLFNEKNRNITLSGEAYFKVASNKALPFIVAADDVTVVATGTEFNVKAYEDEEVIETTLVEGAVIVKSRNEKKDKGEEVALEPRQRAVYVRNRRNLRVEDLENRAKTIPEMEKAEKGTVYVEARIDPDPIISWKDNKMIFKGEKLGSLAVKLGRKYNVTFSFEKEEIKDYRFSGILEDETLTQVLDVIRLSAPIGYRLEGKTVMIYEDSSMMQKFNPVLKRK